jgi:putative endonuclease
MSEVRGQRSEVRSQMSDVGRKSQCKSSPRKILSFIKKRTHSRWRFSRQVKAFLQRKSIHLSIKSGAPPGPFVRICEKLAPPRRPEAVFYVYAIQSLTNSRVYIGQTQDIDRRIAAHNSGTVKSTRQHRPWKLIKSNSCETREAARWLEHSLKSSRGTRIRWLKD